MPLDWLNTPLDADIGELLARKKRAKAIEALRQSLQGRLAPPVTVRLQLADLLMQAGRAEEAVPVLLGLADEFAADGFVAKAVAILKRVDRAQPGRPEVAERLEKLVHQQKRVADLPSRPRSAVPEFGMEEIGEDLPLSSEAVLAAAASDLPAPVDEPEPLALETEDAPAPAPVEVEAMGEPVPAIASEAVPEATADSAPEIVDVETEPVLAQSLDAAAVPPGTMDAEPMMEAEPEEGAAPGTGAGPGVGRRIRRALWRFLASLPGPEEGGATAVIPASGDPAAPSQDAPSPTEAAAPTDVSTPSEAPAASVEAMPDAVASEGAAFSASAPGAPAAAAAFIEFETPPPRPATLSFPSLAEGETEAEPEPEPAIASEGTDEPMTEEVFRDHLLDIVEDVLHRPAAPEETAEMDRALVLDFARRLVASRLFHALSDEELLAIVRGLRLRTFEAGDILVTEGEPGQSLFTLTTGRLKVFVRNPDGRNFEVATLAEGDFFGEISSLSGRPRSATVVAAGECELLELDRPTLDSIARTHARVRDVLETSYIERASSASVAAVRAVPLPDAGTRRKADEVLAAHFGESRWDPRMRLRLADVLLKAGKDEDAIPILVGLADELARQGFADKAVAILKKIEQVQRRHVEVVNLAPLLRGEGGGPPRPSPAGVQPPVAGAKRPETGPAPAPPSRTPPATDDRLHGWLVDLVRDTVAATPSAVPAAAEAPAPKAYGPGLLANPLFEDFSEEELLAFIRGLKLLVFDPGDVIVTEGERGQSVFILTTGRVKVFVRGPENRNVPLGALGEGSFFGEISTLSGRPRSATITAAAACEILELDRAGLDAIAATHPRVRSVLEAFSEARSTDPEAARARGIE
jgi:CRP-like cAMP-binding protein